MKHGDSNSHYFLAWVNKRRNANNIVGLRVYGVWLEDVGCIKEEIYDHFRSRFNGECWKRPVLDGIQFKGISGAHSEMPTSEFSVMEIEVAVWDCDNNKSPGLDGYNFMFIMKFWSLLRDDI